MVGSVLTRGVRTLAQREFWTFKVVHAVFGGLLTVTGACGGIFVTEQIKKQIASVDSTIAEATQRIDSIERQFDPATAWDFILQQLSRRADGRFGAPAWRPARPIARLRPLRRRISMR
jgi:hypothetical protein